MKLDKPIKRGEKEITEIELTKPDAGALRGTTLLSLLQMDVQALGTVLPRISTPAITMPEVFALDPADLLSLGTEVANFLVSAKDRFPSA